MRILVIDGQTFTPAFKAMGHHVFSIGRAASCDMVLTSPLSHVDLIGILKKHSFFPDIVFWQDMCRPPMVLGIEQLPSPSIGYSVDQYCNPWHVPYSASFDCMLVAQHDYLPLFEQSHIQRQLRWFPLFCNPEKDKDDNVPRDIPVSFVGTIDGTLNTERKPFLEAFKRTCPLVLRNDAYQPVFTRSRIVLNQSAAEEINARVFEAQACGAALLTEDIANGLHELFTPGEHILVYPKGDPQAAARIALNALADGSWERIAKAGQQRTLQKHTLPKRAETIIAIANRLLKKGKSPWRQANLPAIVEETKRAYAILALDTSLPLPDELRSFYYAQSQAQ